MNVPTDQGSAVAVEVDKGLCASSGACVFSAPEVFAFDDADEADVLDGAPATSESVLRDIAYNCPAGAITVSTPSEGSSS